MVAARGNGARLYEQDCADARAAHALDNKAHAALLLHAPAATVLLRITSRPAQTRGPFAEALRCLAPRYPDAQPSIQKADILYWGMVERHSALIHRQARAIQQGSAFDMELDDVVDITKTGWYNAALRFDPDRGTRFTTMAGRWAFVRVMRERPPPGGIRSSTQFAVMSSLDEPAAGGDRAIDSVIGSNHDLVSILEQKQARVALHDAIAQLPERDRDMVTLWFATGRMTDAAAKAEITCSRAWQIVHDLVRVVRSKLDAGRLLPPPAAISLTP